MAGVPVSSYPAVVRWARVVARTTATTGEHVEGEEDEEAKGERDCPCRSVPRESHKTLLMVRRRLATKRVGFISGTVAESETNLRQTPPTVNAGLPRGREVLQGVGEGRMLRDGERREPEAATGHEV